VVGQVSGGSRPVAQDLQDPAARRVGEGFEHAIHEFNI
jgi:hypothetical protein